MESHLADIPELLPSNMIEVHHVGRIPYPAVSTRHIFRLFYLGAIPLVRRFLGFLDIGYVAFAVPDVIVVLADPTDSLPPIFHTAVQVKVGQILVLLALRTSLHVLSIAYT